MNNATITYTSKGKQINVQIFLPVKNHKHKEILLIWEICCLKTEVYSLKTHSSQITLRKILSNLLNCSEYTINKGWWIWSRLFIIRSMHVWTLKISSKFITINNKIFSIVSQVKFEIGFDRYEIVYDIFLAQNSLKNYNNNILVQFYK